MTFKAGFFLAAIVSFSAIAPLSPAQAQMSFRQVRASQAQGNSGPVPRIELSPQWGLVLSFAKTGEMIQQARIGDPSRILIDFDSPLAPGGGASSAGNGSSKGASIIYLRQLNAPLDLGLRLPQAAKYSSQVPLTVITTSGSNRKVYQFQIALGASTDSSTVEVVPDSSMPSATPRPLPPLLPPRPRRSTTPSLSPSPTSISPSPATLAHPELDVPIPGLQGLPVLEVPALKPPVTSG